MAVNQQPAEPTRTRVSLKLENFSAGGVLPEGDYLVKESLFTLFTYTYNSGATGVTTTAHRVVYCPVAKKGTSWVAADGATDSDQHYSVGDMTAVVPSEDGNFIDAISTRTTLGKGSNYFLEYEALVNAGLPEDLWESEGAKILNGAVVHITHIPEPDRSAMRQRSAVGTGVAPVANQPAKKDFPKTIPVVKVIHFAPWDKKGAVKGAAAAKPVVNGVAKPATVVTAPATATNGQAADNRAAQFIKDIVAGNGGTYSRTQTRLQAHRQYSKAGIPAAERDAELNAAFGDDVMLGNVLSSINCVLEGGVING